MMHMSHKTQNLTHAQELVTLRTGRPVGDLLRELYVDKGLTQAAIAAELGVTRLTVAMWLREFRVERPAQGAPA
jgi:DNA-binding transcriptional regulator LsrR (DeoR family)